MGPTVHITKVQISSLYGQLNYRKMLVTSNIGSRVNTRTYNNPQEKQRTRDESDKACDERGIDHVSYRNAHYIK